MNYNNNLISRVRNLDMTLRIYAETTPISGSILSINVYGPYDIPQGGRLFYLKGGNNSIKA